MKGVKYMCMWVNKLWEKRHLFASPFVIGTDVEYRDKLNKIFEDLESSLIEANAENFYIQEVQKYKNIFLFTIEEYYCGHIDSAHTKIKELIDEFDDDSLAISNINNSISFGLSQQSQEVQFFRARRSENFTNYEKREMLHIPFSERSKVKSERFSIPGLPCLYLGTTSYVCWLELGRPADHMFNVSPIKLDNTQHIFNLAINFHDFINVVKMSSEDKVSSIKKASLKTVFRIFLLSIVTSFKVKETNRGFKSEYIISQLIMLACMKRGLSGLAYYSKQVENDRFAYSIGVNLALFASYSSTSDLSPICKNICISEPINYSMYKKLTYSQTYKTAKLRVDSSPHLQNIGNFSRQYPYSETEFYLFDRYLFAHLHPENYFNVP